MGFSVYHIDIRKKSNTKYKKSGAKKSVYGTDKEDNKVVYIPQFFEFDIKYFGIDNYHIMSDINGKLHIYITPLIRTLLQDIKVIKNELSVSIKERVNSHARLLLLKSVAKSVIVDIKGKQYLRVNANFRHKEDTIYHIMNDWQYQEKML